MNTHTKNLLMLLTLVAPTSALQASEVTNVVDVHFTYTTERKNNYGGYDKTVGIMRQSQGITNKAHLDSGTGMFFNYVLPRELPNNFDVNHNDSSGIQQLRDNQVPGAHATRDSVGADVIGMSAFIGAAGLAYTGDPGYYAVKFLSGPASAHELGHSFGCGHTESTSGDTAYSHAFSTTNAAGATVGTVLAGAQILRYSTPTQTFEGQHASSHHVFASSNHKASLDKNGRSSIVPRNSMLKFLVVSLEMLEHNLRSGAVMRAQTDSGRFRNLRMLAGGKCGTSAAVSTRESQIIAPQTVP
jgi:hypothetical protein